MSGLTDPNYIIIRLEIFMQLLREFKIIDCNEKMTDFRNKLAEERDKK